MTAKLTLTLESWLRTGAVGPLQIGGSVEELVRILGTTDMIGPEPGPCIPGYWMYGEVEFGIGDRGQIEWIQSDTVNIESELTERGFVELDWQGVYDRMPLNQCVEWLNDFKLNHNCEKDDEGAIITIEDNVQFLLTDVSDPKLVTVWCPPMRTDPQP